MAGALRTSGSTNSSPTLGRNHGKGITFPEPNLQEARREIFRVTMSTVILLGGAARIAGYAGMGLYEGSSVILIAIGLPLVVIGSRLGDRMIRRLDPRMFEIGRASW